MYTHFTLYLKSSFPDGIWSKHSGTDILTVGEDRFIVAALSAWPSIIEINKNESFPRPITPILLADCPFGPIMPKGKWYLGGGTGLTIIKDGLRMGSLPMPKPENRISCNKENCRDCRIMEKFSVDYPCFFMQKYEP